MNRRQDQNPASEPRRAGGSDRAAGPEKRIGLAHPARGVDGEKPAEFSTKSGRGVEKSAPTAAENPKRGARGGGSDGTATLPAAGEIFAAPPDRRTGGGSDNAARWRMGEPNPKQRAFFAARSRFVAYGGARGGGKSWAVRKKAAALALYYAGIRILILRRSYPELRENHILPMRADLEGIALYKESDKSFVFSSGSRILFGYCDSESDVLRYQGQEYDVIFLDEATQFTEFQFLTLTACLRGANRLPKRFYLTCNPGGVGHDWVKRLFIDRRYRGAERAEDYTFIPATVYDNAALLAQDQGYLRMLENLPGPQRRAWLDGCWDLLEGRFFEEFDRAVHVRPPFGIPAHWRRYVALDYGMDMLAACWIAVDEAGRAVVYRELYEGRDNGRGEGGRGHIISAAAARLVEENRGEPVAAWLAPPDLWNRRQETGRSAAEIFYENGVPLTRTGNERVAGWLAVREWLAPRPDEDGVLRPRLTIFDCCTELIRCLASLCRDDKNPEDAATRPHELTHAPDALRGFCSWWISPSGPAPRRTHDLLTDDFHPARRRGDPLGRGDAVEVI